MKKVFVFVLIILWQNIAFSQKLVVYPPPQQVIYTQHNDDFTVKVRTPGGEWQDLFEYNVQVDMDRVQDASMVYFDFSGKVEILVRKNNGNIQSARIRPLSYRLVPEIKENTIQFTLTEPRKISLEINGDKLQNLHVFANPLETFRPDPKDTSVIYFGPGLHETKDKPGNAFNIPSGKTVYIAGGAIVRGKIVCNKAKNIKIIGRGIIDRPERGIEITYSENIEIDGIIIKNPQHYTIYGGQSKGLTIRNIKSFSCKGWSDGIDLMSCSDAVIDDVFMRNSDDCIAIYGHRWNFYGSARNYKISNSTLWADIAHPTTIGIHGNADHVGDTIENITYNNIDILEQDEDDRNYQGCLSINASDNNLVRNIRYENIRIEDIQEGQLFNFRVYYNEKYSAAPGRRIENIYLKNIIYNGVLPNPSIIHGYDEKRIVQGITFENVKINGKVINDAKSGDIRIGENTSGISFKK
jgi:hypothetical protein